MENENKNSKLKIIWLIGLALVFAGVIAFFKFGGIGSNILWDWSDGGRWLLPLVVVASLVDSINPCAFFFLLLTIVFFFSIGKTRGKILIIGGFYILGIFIIYIMIGVGILQALHIFNTPHFMAKVGAALLIAWGIMELIGELYPAFPIKLRIPDAAHSKMAELMEKGSIPTAFFLGGLVGLCEFPCTGGPYLMILGLLHDKGTYVNGLGYLFLYNLIFILPLVIILFIASHETLVAKVRAWQKSERKLMRYGGGIA